MNRRWSAWCSLLVGSVSSILATDAQFLNGGDLYTLRTNTAGGSCLVTILANGSATIDRVDGTSRARGNGATGCELTAGSRQCVIPPLPDHPFASTDVNCEDGNVYGLSTRTDSGLCTTSQDTMGKTIGGACVDGNGNSAKADCTRNGGHGDCESSTGKGRCEKKK
jgi:hypothetical protein